MEFISFIIYTKEYWPASRLFMGKKVVTSPSSLSREVPTCRLKSIGCVLGIFLDFYGTLKISLVLCLPGCMGGTSAHLSKNKKGWYT